MAKKLLTLDNVNPLARELSGGEGAPETVKRAIEIERELRKGIIKPFAEVIRCDINDVQAMGQKPITFTRQVLTTCAYPHLIDDPSIPKDVASRANKILDECGGRSAGAYTYSEGIDLIREHVAEYLEHRDGYPAQAKDVVLSAGSIEALRSILNVLNTSQCGMRIGILVPVPRDPLFTSLMHEFGILQIDYYLDEDDDWSINTSEMESALKSASIYCIPKAILVINPGNPTGSVLSAQNMAQVAKFAFDRKLVLLADETYQFNAFAQGCNFVSFKKTIMDLGAPYHSLELISFMSGSAGMLGECGLRCGCSELKNVPKDVVKVYMKSICVKMCPSVMGQIALDCMIRPPRPQDPSYREFVQEWTEIVQSLNDKALTVTNSLNEVEGIECKSQTATTFIFPRIFIPQAAINEAKSKGKSADTFYALSLLEETGICTLPGELYGQLPDTYHLRLTILPAKDKIQKVVESFKIFNENFLLKYG